MGKSWEMKKEWENRKLTLSQCISVMSEGKLRVKQVDQFLFAVLGNKVPSLSHLKQKILYGKWQEIDSADLISITQNAFNYHYSLRKAELQSNEFSPPPLLYSSAGKQAEENNIVQPEQEQEAQEESKDIKSKEETIKLNNETDFIEHEEEMEEVLEFPADWCNAEKADESIADLIKREITVEEKTTEIIEPNDKQLLKKYKELNEKLNAKLRIIFDFYRRSSQEGWKEDNSKRREHIDLYTFLKYFREYELSSTYPTVIATAIFRRLSVNSLWLSFESFFSAHQILGSLEERNLEGVRNLKLMHQVVSSKKIRKMLNLSAHALMGIVVREHSGNPKSDLIRKIKEKVESKQNNAKRVNTLSMAKHEFHLYNPTRDHSQKQLLSQMQSQIHPNKKEEIKIKKAKSTNNIKNIQIEKKIKVKENNILNHENYEESKEIKNKNTPINIYEQLNLPMMRMKELKQQNIKETLKKIEIGKEKESLKHLINIEEDEEFLSAYFKNESIKIISPVKQNKPYDAPTMKYT